MRACFFILLLLLASLCPISGSASISAFVSSDHSLCRQPPGESLQALYPDSRLLVQHSFQLQLGARESVCFLTLNNGQQTHLLLLELDGRIRYRFETPQVLQLGCEVAAVAFDDFNADALPEIIVVNRCTAADGNTYYANALFWSQVAQWQFDARQSRDISLYTNYGQIRQFLYQNAESIQPQALNPATRHIVFDARLHEYPDGLVLISDDLPFMIYQLKRYPPYLDEHRKTLLNNVFRVSATLLDSQQRGELTYREINVETLEYLE